MDIFKEILEILNSMDDTTKSVVILIGVTTLLGMIYKLIGMLRKGVITLFGQFTTTLIVSSDSYENYANLTQILSKMGKARAIRVVGDRWDDTPFRRIQNSVIVGKFFNQLTLVHSSVEKGTNTYLYTYRVIWLGRSHNPIDKFEEYVKSRKENTYSIVEDDSAIQQFVGEFNHPLPVLPNTEVQGVVDSIDTFLTDKTKKDYKDKGIPYNLGIVLYGNPGTGKTALLRFLMEKLGNHEKKYNTYIVNSVTEFVKVAKIKNSLIILEEFDSFGIEKYSEDKDTFDMSAYGVTPFLKALDGITPSEGRIVLATTNKIDLIDKRLLRKGRFDVKVEMTLFSEVVQIAEFCERYYGTSFSQSNYEVKEPVSGATIQGVFLENRDSKDNFLKELLKIKDVL